MKKIICATIVSGLAVSSSATIINIPVDYPTIQQGIDASADGDTVLVQPGTYVENINFNGHNIVLGSLFLTTGDTSYIEQTVIDGDSAGTVVTFESSEDTTSVITGFTITNASTTGIYCLTSSPTIVNNRIVDNYGYLGGGISCRIESNAIIIDNRIEDNICLQGGTSSGCGGGIFCKYGSIPRIENNYIAGNISATHGGGVACYDYSDAYISGNSIINNSTYYAGGGINTFDSDPIIINNIIGGNSGHMGGGINTLHFGSILRGNVIHDNYAAADGGGMWFGGFDVPELTNNTFYGNEANRWGGAIYCYYGSPGFVNTIFWADSAPGGGPEIYGSVIATYSDIAGGYQGIGNIDVDPLFRDPENGDFHLMSIACGDSADSPCIDAGDPAILDSLLDCSWGLDGPRSDMGAYGGGDSAMVGIFDNISSLPDRIMLFQNYPNPFNAQTTIRFVLPESQDVELIVYGLLGRQVQTLIDEYRQAGTHTVTFDASDLSSGVYFARLETNNATKSIKMLLLK